MYFSVTAAEYVKDYTIKVSFQNGKSGIVDLLDYIKDGEIYQDIRNPESFKKFSIEFGTLVWDNGEVDIAPETLYEMATGEKITLFENSIHKVV